MSIFFLFVTLEDAVILALSTGRDFITYYSRFFKIKKATLKLRRGDSRKHDNATDCNPERRLSKMESDARISL